MAALKYEKFDVCGIDEICKWANDTYTGLSDEDKTFVDNKSQASIATNATLASTLKEGLEKILVGRRIVRPSTPLPSRSRRSKIPSLTKSSKPAKPRRISRA